MGKKDSGPGAWPSNAACNKDGRCNSYPSGAGWSQLFIGGGGWRLWRWCLVLAALFSLFSTSWRPCCSTSSVEMRYCLIYYLKHGTQFTAHQVDGSHVAGQASGEPLSLTICSRSVYYYHLAVDNTPRAFFPVCSAEKRGPNRGLSRLPERFELQAYFASGHSNMD